MNSKQTKTLQAIFNDPINGNLEWSKIESLFISIGCRVIEAKGSGVTFEMEGIREYFHRPHPDKAALKYRIKAARSFLVKLGIYPEG
jgi:hypothetical protein